MAADADFELVAASLRADTGDLEVFVETLAAKLEASLPQHTRVSRRSTRPLSKRKRVERVAVELGEERFVLERGAGGIETRVATTVRGIVLKNERLELGRWIDVLARAVARAAETSEQGRRAVARLLGIENR